MNYNKMLGKRLADFKNLNIYSVKNGIVGQCVWYVRCRSIEKCKVDLGIYGNANTWYQTAVSKKLSLSKSPVSDSIACFSGGRYGHVIFIEAVESGTVYYTEANSNNDNKLSADDGVLKKQSVSSFVKRAGYQGCIVLTPKSREATKKEQYLTMKVIAKSGLNYRTNYKVTPSTYAGTLPYGTKVRVVKGWGWTTGGYTWYKILLNKKYYYCVKDWLGNN